MTDKEKIDLSRRKLLGGLGVLGGAGALGGAATTSLLWDEEKFGTANNPNVLQAGELDLKVDWEVRYYDWIDGTPQTISESQLTNQPGPIVNLTDVKPGDVLEATLSAHVFGNPAFLGWHYQEHADSDNGFTEPEDSVDGALDDSDGDPFAAGLGLGAIGLLGGAVPETVLGSDSGESDETGSSRRKALRAAGGTAASLGALGKAADSVAADGPDKDSWTDPDGQNDVSIDNGTLQVSVGELNSGGGLAEEWIFQGQPTLFRETYGFRDGTSATHQDAENEGSVVSAFPSSVSPGTTASATVKFPNFTNANGDSTPLEVVRKVTLDPNEAILRVEYEVTNTGSAPIDDLRISQYVDYDIEDIGDDFGKYFLDEQTDCEYIWLKDESTDLYAGFTGETLSSNHSLTPYDVGLSEFQSSDPSYNNNERYPPGSGTDDVELTFEWSLGALEAGGTTTFRNSFVYNTSESEFRQELCQESPGEPIQEPEGDGGELDDVMRCVLWYDDGNNIPEEIWTGETDLGDPGPNGSLDAATKEDYVMEVGAAQSPSEIVDTDAAIFAGTIGDSADVRFKADESVAGNAANGQEAEPDFGGTDGTWCYMNSTTEYIGVLCWVPEDIPEVNDNIIQTDRLEFQFGFDAIQCRHNVADDGSPIDGTLTEADAENNAQGPEGSDASITINDQTAGDPP